MAKELSDLQTELRYALMHFENQVYVDSSAAKDPYKDEARIINTLYSKTTLTKYPNGWPGVEQTSQYKVIDVVSALMLLVKLDLIEVGKDWIENIYNIHLKLQEMLGPKIYGMSSLELPGVITPEVAEFLKKDLNGYKVTEVKHHGYLDVYVSIPKEIPHLSCLLNVLKGKLSIEDGLRLINQEKSEAAEAARVAEAEAEAARVAEAEAEAEAQARAEAAQALKGDNLLGAAEPQQNDADAAAEPDVVARAPNWFDGWWCNVM